MTRQQTHLQLQIFLDEGGQHLVHVTDMTRQHDKTTDNMTRQQTQLQLQVFLDEGGQHLVHVTDNNRQNNGHDKTADMTRQQTT